MFAYHRLVLKHNAAHKLLTALLETAMINGMTVPIEDVVHSVLRVLTEKAQRLTASQATTVQDAAGVRSASQQS